MTDTSSVTTIIEAINHNTLDFAILMSAIAASSTSLTEVLKGLFYLLCYFNKREVYSWIPQKEQGFFNEFLVLTVGSKQDENVLYDQPVEQMMGQIQSAANLSLEFPDRYPKVYKFFTKEDSKLASPQINDLPNDSQLWETFATSIAEKGFLADEIPPQTEILSEPQVIRRAEQQKHIRDAQQARVRLGHLIARRLDIFQNRTKYKWAKYNQVLSILLGFGLSFYVLYSSYKFDSLKEYLVLILFSLLAGILAPFAKDVVSVISGLRVRV